MKLKIGTRVALAVGVTTVVLAGLLYLVLRFSLMRIYERFEREAVTSDVGDVAATVETEVVKLKTNATSWGVWDDSYGYLTDHPNDFIEKSVNAGSLKAAETDFLILARTDGVIAWAGKVDASGEGIEPIEPEVIALLGPGSEIARASGTGATIDGLMLAGDIPVLIASAPSLTTSGSGPSHGAIVMGRYVDADFVADMGAKVGIPITAQPVDAVFPADVRARLSAGDTVVVHTVSEDSVAGYAVLRDLAGKPALVVGATWPRTVYGQGSRSVTTFVVAMIVMMLVFGTVIVVLMRKVVLNRMLRIGRTVVQIGKTEDFALRVPVEGADELTEVAAAMNDMLAALESSHTRIVENERMYQTILDSQGEGVGVLDSANRFVFCNPTLEAIVGVRSGTLVGRELGEFVVPESQPILHAHMDALKSGNRGTCVCEIARPDGGRRTVAISAAPELSPDGSVTGALAVFRDDTEQRHATDTIRRQNEAILLLSTPALQLRDGVILMPLIGEIDSARSRQISDKLLHAISENAAQVAILDVTGVPIVDTSVARHLLTVVSAAKILGAEVIVTGFNSEMAQTLVTLDVDVRMLRTAGSLQRGIAQAFEIVDGETASTNRAEEKREG